MHLASVYNVKPGVHVGQQVIQVHLPAWKGHKEKELVATPT